MKLRIALGAAVAALAATSAAHAATATAAASANIVAPGALTSTRDLNFGTIARPTTGSNTITVASQLALATPGISGGGDGSIPVAGQGQAAIFHLVGSAAQTYTVGVTDLSFPSAGTNLTSVGAESPTASAGSVVGTLPAGGVADLYVGGHFSISPTTAVNTYSGTLSLTINFN